MNAITIAHDAGEIMESVIAKGDLGKLSAQERSTYYMQVCRSIGLNPLTRPFEYLTLNGKMVLYARRDCADQLRKINNISVEIVSKDVDDGLLTVHVRAKDSTGRVDEDYGVVNIGALKGEAAANAFLKAVTKAKRRVTLSISGLGFLDESEVEDTPAAAKAAPKPIAIAKPAPVEHDLETGEVGPRELPMPQYNGGDDWIAFGQSFLAAVRAAKSPDEVMAWGALNQGTIERMKSAAPKVHARLIAAIAPPPQPEPETLDIPPALDRRTAKPTAEAFDADAWLKALDAAFTDCNTGEGFVAIEASLFRPNIERASPADVKRANKIREEHYVRITQDAA